MKMIIYMYLTIIIVFSILTGIITTIVEKKGLHNNAQYSFVQNVSAPSKIMRARRENQVVSIPVIQPDSVLYQAPEQISITEEFDSYTLPKEEDDYYDEPVLLAVIEEDIF